MNTETIIQGLLDARESLRDSRGISSPTYISENMQVLAQHLSIAEERLAEMEAALEIVEAEIFKGHLREGKSVNAALTNMRYQVADRKAQIIRMNRLVSSSWKLISASQSRMKHLVAEASNQI